MGFIFFESICNNRFYICQAALDQLNLASVGDSMTWLNIVWSFTVLDKANTGHFQSVLSPEFVTNMISKIFT